MAIWAVSITKRSLYRGEQEEFANVYHYRVDSKDTEDDWSDSEIADFAREVAAQERPYTSGSVGFRRARVWGPIGGPPSSVNTIGKISLSGFGDLSSDSRLGLEDVFVVSFKTVEESIRDRPVYLRKWLRPKAAPDGSTLPDSVIAVEEPLPDTVQTALESFADDIAGVAVGGVPDFGILVSPQGRQIPANQEDFEIFPIPWLERHELRY